MSAPKPRLSEFLFFTDLLVKGAPVGYTPHLFKCKKGGKEPVEGISWKSPLARLTVEEALNWMAEGGNIGIAGTADDPLVLVDDDTGKMKIKATLKSRSRSRKGGHGYYFSKPPKIPNIATENDGEVRSQWQYVIVPGSYVETDSLTVPESDRENAGYYTVENARPPAWITFDELPQVFRDQYNKDQSVPPKPPATFNPQIATGRHSALFDVNPRDIAAREGRPTEPRKRWPAIWHDSKTGANMSLSTNGLLHCWRHNRSFNGLQALTVLSGYMGCSEAGTPHRGAGGSSQVIGDNGAIFHAWLYAKNHSYIPEDDPIPVKALNYIAEKHLGYKAKDGELLPRDIYRRVLQIVEAEY
jgi:putative DNA primase/helicase